MQHYQMPSAEYSNYINHVVSLGLAEDYIAQLRASCSSERPLSLRAAITQAADTCLEWWMISSQCRSLPLVCPAGDFCSRMEHQSQTLQVAWAQPCLSLS